MWLSYDDDHNEQGGVHVLSSLSQTGGVYATTPTYILSTDAGCSLKPLSMTFGLNLTLTSTSSSNHFIGSDRPCTYDSVIVAFGSPLGSSDGCFSVALFNHLQI